MEFVNEILDHSSLADHTQEWTPDGWEELFVLLSNDLKQIQEQLPNGDEIYPDPTHVFEAFHRCHPSRMKCVILGQDPYHTPGAAHGLSFSIQKGLPIQPSLRNIFKKLKMEGYSCDPKSGDLTSWAREGVLLLNSTLTVSRGKANSHAKIWAMTTRKIIEYLNDNFDGLVWIVWGGDAKKKTLRVDHQRHQLIIGIHPSPLSAHRGFFDQDYFRETNHRLERLGKKPIDWNLS